MFASHLACRVRAARRELARLVQSHAAPMLDVEDSHKWSGPSAEVRLASEPTPTNAPITVVRDRRTAARVVSQLMSLPPDAFVAWDTETTGVNPAKESPVGKGSVICATAFAGDEVDFGNGPRLFIDCLDGECGRGMLDVFKGYFENERCKKVWHNYAFDCHVLSNHGIVTSGFGGDTMHMARLVDTSRQKYSLQELCRTYLDDGALEKETMTERFGRPERLKSGTEGKKVVVSSTVDLQRSAEFGKEWIEYAAADAELTYRLCNTLKVKLENMIIDVGNDTPQFKVKFKNLYELYNHILLPFGEVLTDIERTGFKVDVDWLKKAERKADKERVAFEDRFRAWAAKDSPDARYMNLNSDLQKRFLFFAPCTNAKRGEELERLPKKKSFCIQPEDFLPDHYVTEIVQEESKRKSPEESESGAKKGSKPRKLKREIILTGLGKPVVERTASGWPSVSGSALQKLADKLRAEPGNDDLQKAHQRDPDMAEAIDDMISATRISTLISTFMVPLQNWPGQDGRIHASLNINTETGRLSSRRPNLQNQPALEKDRYLIRNAFIPEERKTLIVADYGQLELRLLAHITNCKSMINAFEAGGDFHSRTALTMFDYVAGAVERGECLLERDERGDYSNSAPLLKDMFSAERRKAKTLNFSIAYGKTVKGLAKDWNVSNAEAGETLNLWYKEREEVRQWQEKCKATLQERGYVETVLGRRRHLPDVASRNYKQRAHAERAAINAPLQGSAADLVMAAMVKLRRNRVLSALGWKIILQIHDEIVLEGPEESAEMALPIVVNEMRNPIDFPLRVDLTVDAKCANSWYQAK